MGEDQNPQRSLHDVAVVGAGLNGLAAALAFAEAGFGVQSVGPRERPAPGRTVALFGPSLDLMASFGLLDEVQRLGAPLRRLRIIDDTGSLFAPRPVEFRAQEIGLEAFGWNIENQALAGLLAGALAAQQKVLRREETVARLGWREDSVWLRDSAGAECSARLVVAADGRNSPTRRAARIEAPARPYPQSALTLFLRHAHPHDDVSTEFHTRQGPFTLVPLAPAAGAENRSSLVWLMSEAEGRRRVAIDDAELAREIEMQSQGLLGRVEIKGERGLIPMVQQNARRLFSARVALVGDAAHVYPPIGAQGLNLGLRDVQALVTVVADAAARGDDIGSARTLAAYQRSRGPDIAARTLAVNGLNLSLIANLAPVDALRGLGLTALSAVPALRRFVMREGVSPRLSGLAR